MPEINLPTKSTQDTIKTTTDTIKTTADTIKNNTDGVKAKTDLIGVANPATAGTDTVMNYLKKIYDTAGAEATKWFAIVENFNTNTNYTTVLNVTGKGVLYHAITHLATTTNASNKIGHIKITVDNILILQSTSIAHGTLTGLVGEKFLYPPRPTENQFQTIAINESKQMTTYKMPTYISNDFGDLPMINEGSKKISLTPGIPFKSSIKIELLNNTDGYLSLIANYALK